MCGRFVLDTPAAEIAEAFGLDAAPDVSPRYNIAPTQPVAVIRLTRDATGRGCSMMHWGLIPSWADDPSIGNRMINARAESLASKPAFSRALERRRCIIPASGFFEWKQRQGGGKQPMYIHRGDLRPLGFAGLWEIWSDAEGNRIDSCAIITTEANDMLRPVHDRMPAILEPADYAAWLDVQSTGAEAAAALLRPADADILTMYPVNTRVNKPENDDPSIIEGVAEASDEQQTLF